MIRFYVFGVRFAVPLPALLMPLLARILDTRGVYAAMAALAIHEGSHMAAAAMMHVDIAEVRLLPFGGSIRIENPYALRPAQLIAVAAAGPIGNLAGAVCCAALAHWRIVSPAAAAEFAGVSWALMLFNLLPAMPLDGGRICHAVLQKFLGRRTALKVCLVNGHVLAAAMLLLFAYGALRGGGVNITLLMAALLLIISGRDEKNALALSEAMRFTRRSDANPRPARIYQLREDAPVRDAVRLLRPKEDAWFVLTRRGIPCAAIDSESLLAQMQKTGMSPAMRDLTAMPLNMPDR